MLASTSLTGELRRYSKGDREFQDSLFSAMFPRLRQVAARTLSRERSTVPVTPTELVGETWLCNLRRGRWTIESREHFFNIAGLAMENALRDMARKRLAQRRGHGAIHVALGDISLSQQPKAADAEQVMTICLLLERLAKEDAKVAQVVRLHYVVGFSLEEIVAETGLSLRQIRYRWEKGKVWLATELAPNRSRSWRLRSGHA